MADDRIGHDWEAIGAQFRAGQVSIREIARQHGLSDTAIRKQAKAEGWERDLTEKVREQVRTDLVRDAVRTDSEQEPEIVKAAAAIGVEVVRSHRRDLSRLRRIAERLGEHLDRYMDLLANRPADDDQAEQEKWQAAVGAALAPFGMRESTADVLDKVTKAIQRIVPLERQAFNLDEPAKFDPGAFVTPDQVRRMAREVLEDGGEC